MIAEFAVTNFAIIDSLRVNFGRGLNVLTGETGAGKSIIIDALGAVLGERVSADLVRTGSALATIDLVVELDGGPIANAIVQLIAEVGAELEEGQLILSREITSSGRSIARLNGRVVTATTLRHIGELLVDIHGQSDHLSLLRPGNALLTLDRYAVIDEERRLFGEQYRVWRGLDRQLRNQSDQSRERAQRIDLLAFQVAEIEAAALEPGEEERLANERSRLAHVERLLLDLAAVGVLLRGDQASFDLDQASAINQLNKASSLLRSAAEIDDSLTPMVERLDEQLYLLEDLGAELRDYQERLEADPERLAVVDDRLDLIKNLKRKYGASIEEVLSFGASARAELQRLQSEDVDEASLAERLQTAYDRLGRLAEALSSRRQSAAARLAPEIERSIQDLRLGGAVIVADVQSRRVSSNGEAPGGHPVPFDESGADQVEFLFAPNQGEGLKPLSRIASGGEMARIMLAVKSVLAEADATPTLVFDEIDAGVGGRSGDAVGQKLLSIASDHQVIAITHLPQIAAYADHHFVIRKRADGGRTSSGITKVEGQARVDEIAAMLDGEPVTETSRKKATEMLERRQVASKQPSLS
jgi:DNA repair protein RecN (Recombination protein N)